MGGQHSDDGEGGREGGREEGVKETHAHHSSKDGAEGTILYSARRR